MNILFRHALVALCLVAIGCSSATDPTPPPEDEFTQVAEASIGPDGGVLAVEGFELEVPAGAFAGTQDLVLGFDADAAPLGDSAGPGLYRLQGLPDHYDAPLRIALAGEAERDLTPRVAVGTWRLHSEAAEPEFEYLYHEPADSSGHLVALLPARPAPDEDAARAEARNGEFRIWIIYASAWGENEHLSVVGPSALINEIQELANLLVDHFAIAQNQLQLVPDKWPVDDKIQVIVEAGEYAHRAPRAFIEHTYLFEPYTITWKVGANWIEGDGHDELAAKMGGLFIHTYQYLIDVVPGWGYHNYHRSEHRLVHKAFQYWFEKVFTDDPIYEHPSNFTSPSYMMTGAHLHTDVDTGGILADLRAANLGPMVDYLMAHPAYGHPGYLACVDSLVEANPVWDAFFVGMAGAAHEWLPEFYGALVMGQHYGVDLYQDLTIEDVWFPDEALDPLFTVEDLEDRTYNDLAAKIYAIDLNQVSFAPDTGIHFRVASADTDDHKLSVLVLGRGPEGLFYVGEGREWLLAELQAGYVDQQVDALYAIVVNGSHLPNYLGESVLQFSAELTTEETFDICDFSLTCDAWYHESGAIGDELFEDQNYYVITRGLIDTYNFTLPATDTTCWGCDSTVVTGQVHGEFSEDFSILHDFTANWEVVEFYEGQPTGRTRAEQVRVTGPIEMEIIGGMPTYRVTGTELMTTVVELGSTITSIYGTWTLVEPVFTAESELMIRLQ